MKVLKNGVFYHPDNKVVCLCGCEFTFTLSDVQKFPPHKFGSGKPPGVVCPQCSHVNPVARDQLAEMEKS